MKSSSIFVPFFRATFLICFILLFSNSTYAQTPKVNPAQKETKTTSKKAPPKKKSPNKKVDLTSVSVKKSCDEIRKIVADSKKYQALSPDDQYLYSLKLCSCALNDLNKGGKKKVGIMRPNKDNPDRIYFDLIDLSDAEKAKEALCKTLEIAPALILKDKNLATIVTAVGSYSIESFMEAATKNDPLFILSPVVIPGNKLTKSVLTNLKNNKVYDKASKTWKNNKGTITMILPGVGIPTQGAEQVGNELKRGSVRVLNEVKRIF